MRYRSVPAAELSTKSLRASNYVINPQRVARELVEVWSREFGGLLGRGNARKRLMELIEKAVRRASETK